MSACTYVEQVCTNYGAWLSTNSYCYIGAQGTSNYNATMITFRTPLLPCYSNSISFTLGMAQGSASSVSLCYAIATSYNNKNLYANTYGSVSDGYQVASGTTTLSGISTTVTYKTITINTGRLVGGQTYYLYLWSAVNGNSNGFVVIQPTAYVTHSIDITSSHSPGAAATCTTAQTCSKCGATIANALGHAPGAAATCTSNQTCTRCGAVLAYALGHAPGAAASCASNQTCRRCGAVLAYALGHNSVYGGTASVHTKCSRCGGTLTNGNSHRYTKTTQAAATCTGKGTSKYSCACGYSYTSQDIPALGHTSVNGGTANAHTKCSRCGTVLSSTHSYTKTTQTAPSCTEKGTTKYSCSCGYSYTSQDIPATGHSYQATVVAPTCTSQGYTSYKCSRCNGTKANDTFTAALGHKYKGVVTTEPTFTENGVMTYTCSQCGESYTEIIPKKSGGLIYIDNGSKFEAYQIYIDNGTGWDLYLPYIDNGSGWDLCT